MAASSDRDDELEQEADGRGRGGDVRARPDRRREDDRRDDDGQQQGGGQRGGERHCRPAGVGAERPDEVVGLHLNCVPLSETPGDRRQAAMQRDPDRRLAHAEARRRLADRAALDGNRRDHRALAGRQHRQRLADLALARPVRLRGGGKRLGDLVDVDVDAPAAPPPRVDQLVAGDRIEPRRHRRIGLPGVAFHVNGQQRFLHDVLRIDAALPGAAPGKAAHQDRGALQEGRVGAVVAGKCRPQQPRKFGFVHAGQLASPLGISPETRLCYVAAQILSKGG